MEKTEIAAVVADTGPLLHLDELGVLSLLESFASVLIPATVRAEFVRHRPSSAASLDALAEVAPTPSTLPLELVRLASALALDRGELEALQLLASKPSSIFLTDDAAARLAATQIGYRVHGTIGVLVRAARLGLRSSEEVIALLEDVPIKSTLYIRLDILQAAIAQLKTQRA